MPHQKSTDLDMTKHSDYFVWKDTSERMAWRCDETVNKKRENSCVLKYLFLEGVEQQKISPKKTGNALSNALLKSRFQKFRCPTRCRTDENLWNEEWINGCRLKVGCVGLKSMMTFEKVGEKFRGWRQTKRAKRGFKKLIRINSGPKILRSYFLHCLSIPGCCKIGFSALVSTTRIPEKGLNSTNVKFDSLYNLKS